MIPEQVEPVVSIIKAYTERFEREEQKVGWAA